MTEKTTLAIPKLKQLLAQIPGETECFYNEKKELERISNKHHQKTRGTEYWRSGHVKLPTSNDSSFGACLSSVSISHYPFDNTNVPKPAPLPPPPQ